MTQLDLNLPPGKSCGCTQHPATFYPSTTDRLEFPVDICAAVVRHVLLLNPPWVIVDGWAENECFSFRLIGQLLSPKAPRCPANRPIIAINARRRNLRAMAKADQNHAEESIFIAVDDAVDRWLERNAAGDGSAPFTLLRRLVEARDCIPASALAHVLLFHLAHQPLTNAYAIFDVCALLQSSPDADQYSEAALNGLRALSRALNRKNYTRARRIRDAADVHAILYRMSAAKDPFPPGFQHIPNAQMSSVLL